MADWEYSIRHYWSIGGSSSFQTIEDDVISIPMLTDTGSGEVNSAIIVLNAVGGQYISDDTSGDAGAKRLIKQHDIIRVRLRDSTYGTSAVAGTQQGEYIKYFNVVKKIPIKSKSEGVRLQLELLGVEKWLQGMNYAKPHYFQSAGIVFEDICNSYNANKGTDMPTITDFQTDKTTYPDSKNDLDLTADNVWDFGVNEDNCFDRMSEVIDKLGASASAGGVLDFYDLRMLYDANGDEITPEVFSSGNETAVDGSGVTTEVGGEPIITVANSTAVNVGESDGGIEAEEGTLINSWGANDAGSLPTAFSRFMSRQEWWNLYFPPWVVGTGIGSNTFYKASSKVSYTDAAVGADQGNRKNYVAKIDHNSTSGNKPPDATTWAELTSGDYYGNGDSAPTAIEALVGKPMQYSPWTVDKRTLWINGGGNPEGGFGLINNPSNSGVGKTDGRYDNARPPSMFDHNIVIRDGEMFRTWVDQVATSQTVGTTYADGSPQVYDIQNQYLYNSWDTSDPPERSDDPIVGDAFYRGFRVLCRGDPSGSSPWFGYTNDKTGGTASSSADVVDFNGRLIANSVLEYDGTQWRVLYRPYSIDEQFTGTTDPQEMQVAVLYEGCVRQFTYVAPNWVWKEYQNEDNGNDCFHPVVPAAGSFAGAEPRTISGPQWQILNVPGTMADATSQIPTDSTDVEDVDDVFGWNSGAGTNCNSAIESVFNWSPWDVWNLDGTLLSGGGRITEDYYQSGGWLSFRFPYPASSFNSISESVGDLYGGGTNTDNPREPTTVDAQNMHLTHDGKRGFNQGGSTDADNSSEDFGQISGISFMIKLYAIRKENTYLTGTGWEETSGEDGSNFKIRVALVDSADTVVTQDFTIYFNDTWQSVTLPLQGFEVYRGRQPRYESPVVHSVYPPKGLDVQDIFLWRDIRLMSIFTLDSYDDFGRYHPGEAKKWIDESKLDATGLFFAAGYSHKEVRLAIDAFRFTKPLLVNTGKIAGQVIDPEFLQRPEIGNYEMLKSDAEAERQKKTFQHVEYDTTTTGKIDIGFGDYFNFEDSDIIPSNLEDTTDKIKLVAKRIEYSITKPLNGKGGFLRRIRGVRRFT